MIKYVWNIITQHNERDDEVSIGEYIHAINALFCSRLKSNTLLNLRNKCSEKIRIVYHYP